MVLPGSSFEAQLALRDVIILGFFFFFFFFFFFLKILHYSIVHIKDTPEHTFFKTISKYIINFFFALLGMGEENVANC